MSAIEKPPLGLKPESIHLRGRYKEIKEAMARYRKEGKKIPEEWIDESAHIGSRAINKGYDIL